jgi:hypothetical protein
MNKSKLFHVTYDGNGVDLFTIFAAVNKKDEERLFIEEVKHA